MNHVKELIKNFFSRYEARFNDALKGKEDIDGTVNSFTSCFMNASPAGINCGKNDISFREAIPVGNAFYKSIGAKLMKINRLEITSLDELHFMVKVHWDSLYEKKNSEQVTINFDVIYFLQLKDNELKIFLYITGDEQKAFKESGLIK